MEKTIANNLILENKTLKVVFSNMGASVVSITYKPYARIITYGYKDILKYNDNPDYLGCIIGPTIGRISEAKIDILDKSYYLEKNYLAKHNLHYSSNDSLKNKDFKVIKKSKRKIIFLAQILNYLNGANLNFFIIYKLFRNSLILKIKTLTDKLTYINPSTHLSFNLKGCSTIKDHLLQFNSKKMLKLDDQLLPIAIDRIDPYYDFNKLRKIALSDENFKGYDNSYLLDKNKTIILKASDLNLKLKTNSILVHIYTGNYYTNDMELKSIKSKQYGAISIECSDILNYPVLKEYSMGLIKKKRVNKIKWSIYE